MTGPSPNDESEDIPPCPVCGNDDVPCNVYEYHSESFQGEVCECNACHAMIPTEALKKWDASRRLSVDGRIERAAALLSDSAKPFDEACAILRELLVR